MFLFTLKLIYCTRIFTESSSEGNLSSHTSNITPSPIRPPDDGMYTLNYLLTIPGREKQNCSKCY